jgi:hypothetical protein
LKKIAHLKHSKRPLIGVSPLEKDDFDTEENEFVCDLLYELASLVEVEINEDLNNGSMDPPLTPFHIYKKCLSLKKSRNN